MKRIPLLLCATLGLATAAFAAGDPVKTRETLMDANGAAAALSGAILKGDIEYSPVAGAAAIHAFAAVAASFGDYFPEGSAADSKASPKIWEDAAGFKAELDKFALAASDAVKAAGEKGPADKAAFQAAVQPILGTCKSCHEGYRLK